MDISDEGINFLKNQEQFRSHYYTDPRGVGTIGWGHTRTAKPGMIITKDQGQALLKNDLKRFVDRVNKYVKVPLNQNQLDALVSWDYNTGSLTYSTLLKKLNAGDYGAVGNEMKKWYYSGGKPLNGLIKRRNLEAQLFNKPVPEEDQSDDTDANALTPSSSILHSLIEGNSS